eukprot:CAMPEP_0174921022 /NCGR_PEP_ID=MMETSP1355-20121228/4861_1 /TAXON_ID=464990 /ORGANISM="Hemiselmis tepida, Strain CCMP443" /LENGTH=123 /DNA_ID=CAMNT_0016166455 /DNA_START=26 /DNA_END=394 /DNA_ORIENTATION=-
MAEEAISKGHVEDLMRHGYVVIDGTFPPEMARSVVGGAARMRSTGKLSIVAEQWSAGRQDEIMVMDTWDPSWGEIPPEFQGVASACEMLKGVAAAVSRHAPEGHEWARLRAPAFMQLAVYGGD